MAKKFRRNGQEYSAWFAGEQLIRLFNETTRKEIPGTTQTFRRLADHNRGGRFEAGEK